MDDNTVIRLVVLGGAGVGKSAVSIRFVRGVFVEKYDPTIEESYRKPILVDEKNWVLEILDTAGTDQFAAMRDMYIQRGDGFILVYSVSSDQSVDRCEELYKQISRLNEERQTHVVLVANKVDLPQDQQTVKKSVGERKAAEWNCPFLESSAKENKNIEELFLRTAQLVIDARKASSSGKKPKKKTCVVM
mmetsp:Transcript_20634/g.79021  ORF Transcript_20634/g.79021 Transcript_20634/m.79021 type:complete len:190 (+) Transcript_20634:193-762(+)|eukprot:CAMPEP_0114635850 /NCGR_PEP_ID=MMETSP0168-20121206/16690_1 /TAXON_ID=95228 ORGANISM="Vannella sp., Strain DIVA3 517/6/12" /NCGR_SAMPLE_ID=MMETSP0168 /ASSEMBLY_ACC=CAM_ASM_000044 /LENGTH=189 /DNA_ID=CAMNT_0001847559 /DNA_START=122 /DNA_END=691 /DNA_ORIENTATION=+